MRRGEMMETATGTDQKKPDPSVASLHRARDDLGGEQQSTDTILRDS